MHTLVEKKDKKKIKNLSDVGFEPTHAETYHDLNVTPWTARAT